LGEKIGAFFQTFSFVFSGGLKKYKPIESESKSSFRIAKKKG
jgi:hypothetical protein